MSWLSNLWEGTKNVVSSVASTVGSVVKKVATPALSFAAGLVPGVGPLLSKGVDILGNKLLGEDGDPSSAAGQQSATPVADLLGQLSGQPMGLGSSPAAKALAAATAQAEPVPVLGKPAPGLDVTSNFLGIGGSAPGVFGIGDGKPGVFGIGTGKHQAAEVARQQAEDAAKGEGLSPAQVKLAGQQAADRAQAAPSTPPSSEADKTPWGWIIGAAAALLALG